MKILRNDAEAAASKQLTLYFNQLSTEKSPTGFYPVGDNIVRLEACVYIFFCLQRCRPDNRGDNRKQYAGAD